MRDTIAVSPDGRLLQLLQGGFPLVRQPYEELGRQLGLSGSAVIARIEKLKEDGMVRQIGPVIDGRRLGYQSTLLGMQIAPEQLALAERIIIEHRGISHAYEREHAFNIWVTLVAPPGVSIETEVARLAAATGATATVSLPALKVFKLKVHFGPDDDDVTADSHAGEAPPARVALSVIDRRIINELQRDLPLSPAPFDDMSKRLGMDGDTFLAICEGLIQSGVIRRYGASINHRRAGYSANAMVCWRVAPERVDAAGAELAAHASVSHCYERQTSALWRHNLFAMIHGVARQDCVAIAKAATTANELNDGAVLFSTREIKKTRIKYEVSE
ncbi:MAG: Lrp/AsnC family transcriptional regulator [Dehalococcoidia bacterium]|nr:MAG: Lrp/AsnC family transcriptional regulator [Dehalococcoidia bacterium]